MKIKSTFAGLLLCLLASVSFAQVQIRADGDPVVGRLVTLVADVEITEDAEGLPSHSIEWDSDHPLLEYAVQPAPNVLILPTGLRPDVVKLKVRIIDWESRRIDLERVEINIVGEAGEPPVIEPPVDPPGKDPPKGDWAGLEEKTAELFGPMTNKWIVNLLADRYEQAAGQIGTDVAEARRLIQQARADAFRGVPELEQNYNQPLTELSKLIAAREPLTAGDYKAAIEAVVRGLRTAAG